MVKSVCSKLLMAAAFLAAVSCSTSNTQGNAPAGMGQGGPGQGSGQFQGGAPGGQGGPQGGPPVTQALAAKATSSHFTDLTSATAEDNAYIDALYEKGLFTDWGTTFHPDQKLTRGELATLLKVRYKTVPADAAVRADEAVTHGEAARWIYQAELTYGMPPDMASTDLSKVKDASSIGADDQKAVATVLRIGVFQTNDGVFEPQGTFTRAQIAAPLYRLMSLGGGQGGPGGTPPNGAGPGLPPGGGTSKIDQGTAVAKVSTDVTGTSYTSRGNSENALRVEGVVAPTLTNIVVNKTAGAAGSGDNSNFYGANAGVLVTGKAKATFVGPQVTTSARGANGIFVYGAGTSATVTDAVIKTSEGASGGIMVAGGASAVVRNATIETQGGSSAPLRTDRGGGTLTVDGGSYTSHGDGSPAVYSTAAVTVKNAVLTATGSEAIVVEGKNSVTLENTVVTGHMVKDNVENLQNVMIYQSMSGDASVGKSSFTMTGGSLTSQAGDLFYVTNTSCTVKLTGVALSLSNDTLLKVVGNDARKGWGRVGANGGQCDFTADGQTLTGIVKVDGISKLNLALTKGSSFTGTINPSAQAGSVAVSVDPTSTWTLTADAHVSSLVGPLDKVNTNGFHLWVAGVQVK